MVSGKKGESIDALLGAPCDSTPLLVSVSNSVVENRQDRTTSVDSRSVTREISSPNRERGGGGVRAGGKPALYLWLLNPTMYIFIFTPRFRGLLLLCVSLEM